MKADKTSQEEEDHTNGFTFSSMWEKEVAIIKMGKKKADKILTHLKCGLDDSLETRSPDMRGVQTVQILPHIAPLGAHEEEGGQG